MKNTPQWKHCDDHAALDILHTTANLITAYTRLQRRTGKDLGIVAQVTIEYAPGHYRSYWIAQDVYADKPPTPFANYKNGRYYGVHSTRTEAGDALAEKAHSHNDQ